MRSIPAVPQGLDRIRRSLPGLLPGPETLVGGLGRAVGYLVEAAAWEVADWATEPSRRHLRSLRSPDAWRRPVPTVASGTVATVVVVSFELRRRGRRKAHSRLVVKSIRSAVGR